VYGLPPLLIVSVVCAKLPLAIAGNATDCGPDVASVTTALTSKALAHAAADGL
jgi:hypothetical protein